MKDLVLMIVLCVGLIVVSVVLFWVWIATLLIWKIFAIAGAVVTIICFLMAYNSATKY